MKKLLLLVSLPLLLAACAAPQPMPTAEQFAALRLQQATKETVLRQLGAPSDQVRYASVDGEVWVYRYKEAGVWDSLMHVEFDRKGVLQAMVSGPEPERESRWLR